MALLEIQNELLLCDRLCVARTFNVKSEIHDRLLLNLYSSLELSGKHQLSSNNHKAAILSLDIEDGENRYLLAAGITVVCAIVFNMIDLITKERIDYHYLI